MSIAHMQLVVVLTLFSLWLLPVILVAASGRGTGIERAVWALGCILTSWLGFVAFLLSTRKTSH